MTLPRKQLDKLEAKDVIKWAEDVKFTAENSQRDIDDKDVIFASFILIGKYNLEECIEMYNEEHDGDAKDLFKEIEEEEA